MLLPPTAPRAVAAADAAPQLVSSAAARGTSPLSLSPPRRQHLQRTLAGGSSTAPSSPGGVAAPARASGRCPAPNSSMEPAEGAIRRASTWHYLGGSSPRASSPRSSGLPTWRRPASGGGGGDASAPAALGRPLVLLVVTLYTCALLGMPLLYSSFTARHAAGGLGPASGGDLAAAAAAEGVVGSRPVARRAALERGGGRAAAAATALWPGVAPVLVEYRDAGAISGGGGSCAASNRPRSDWPAAGGGREAGGQWAAPPGAGPSPARNLAVCASVLQATWCRSPPPSTPRRGASSRCSTAPPPRPRRRRQAAALQAQPPAAAGAPWHGCRRRRRRRRAPWRRAHRARSACSLPSPAAAAPPT